MRRSRLVRGALLVILSASAAAVAAQQGTPPPAAGAGPTKEAVQARIDALAPLEQAGELDEAGRVRLDLYRQALASLVKAEEWARTASQFDAERAQVPAELESVRAELAQAPTEPKPEPPADATLAQLQQGLEQAQADLTAAQAKLKELQDEPQRRGARRTEIPERIARLQQRLEELDQQLAASPPADEPAEMTDARRAALEAERRMARAELAALESERLNYEARNELLPQRRERWVRRVDRLDKLVKAWQELVDRQRAEDIRRQQAQAKRDVKDVDPLVAPISEQNVVLSKRRDELRPRIEQARQQLTAIEGVPAALERQRARLEEKVEAVGLTATVGSLLRRNRATLPEPREYRRNIEQRKDRMAAVEFERLTYEDQYEALEAETEQRAAEILAGLDPDAPESRRAEVETQAREELRKMRSILGDLNTDLNDYFNRLRSLNETEQRIADLSEAIADFIDIRILWIRSAPPFYESRGRHLGTGLRWLFGPSQWKGLGQAVWTNMRARWPVLVVAALLLGGLVALRDWLRRRIVAIAKEIKRASTDTFGRTVQAAVYTILRASVWPAVLWSIGQWLVGAGPITDFAEAIGMGLRRAAVLLFLIQLVRAIARPNGLGEAHFRWRPANLKALRRHLAWLSVVVVPCTFITTAVMWQDEEAVEASLGRLSFMASMIALAVFTQRVLRPSGGIVHSYLGTRRGGWVDRLKYLWFPLAITVPLALAAASGIGYHYTAVQLSGHVVESLALVLGAVVLQGLLLRWLVVAHRKLAMEEARKRRAAMEADQARAAAATPEVPPSPDEQEVDLAAIGAQNRQLLRSLLLFTVLLGLWWIWVDAFPALGFLERVELWSRGTEAATAADGGDAVGPAGLTRTAAEAETATDGGEAAAIPMVSLADLLVAVIVLVVTVIVSKNIPGLLEITILKRLPLEPGGQYAIVTVLRYALSIIGAVVAFGILGWTWSRLQWIAAAITFGLGFGLQEIFANFVSGLILLLERPVRVGDVVTVGTTSGKVTKIRMRATTVTDWDRKELIIPNKDFVTGSIINWTLSDPILRLVVPVGIAYGSDTALAEKLLLQAARDHPVVLDEPPPSVVFNGFGESSLDFHLRVFMPHIDHFIRIRHEMHNAIDRLFREAGIEIAFPQRDLHVRSIAPEIKGTDPIK